ncbi:MAG: GGDEF domain-containing protein, partial [Evtepia sp.]
IWCDIYATIASLPARPLHVIGKITDVDHEVRERERLTHLSERDTLTGLFNKTAFHAALDSFLDDPHMSEQHAALFFVDIDHFKQLNDQLGHIAGDDAIITIAETLKRIFRTEDIIGRFGGDEFFIFTQGIPVNILKQKAESVCRALELNFGETVFVSASVGVFSFAGTTHSRKEILERADEALYDAKQSGKNRYVFYSDEQ